MGVRGCVLKLLGILKKEAEVGVACLRWRRVPVPRLMLAQVLLPAPTLLESRGVPFSPRRRC